MFDHPSRHADDASDTDLDIKGQNSKNEKTNTEMLDSFIDEMLKEAKKNKVNKKKNLVQSKTLFKGFFDFQRDQFFYQKKQDQKLESMFGKHFSQNNGESIKKSVKETVRFL